MTDVLIIDDNLQEAKALSNMLAACAQLNIEICPSIDCLKSILATQNLPQVAFVDIQLSEEKSDPTGIDIVERMQHLNTFCQVVYMSGYDAYHTSVYRTSHAGYLRKPFSQEEVAETWQRVAVRIEQQLAKPLCFHSGGQERVLRPAEIMYLESNLRRICIHSVQGSFDIYGKLGDLLDRLPSNFVRCHQSFAVNLDYVNELLTASFCLTNGNEVPVSRRYRPAARDALVAHVRAGA